MTSPGGVALGCVRCVNGYSVLTLSHLRAEPMSKEQLDAVKDQLLSEDNSDLRQSVFSAYLEEPERGAAARSSVSSAKCKILTMFEATIH